MTEIKEEARLLQVSKLVTDQKLAKMQLCAAARASSLQSLQDLNAASMELHECPIVQAKNDLSYGRWADARRSEINIILASQTAAWLDARSEARLAFGRSQILQKLIVNRGLSARGSNS